MTKSKLRVLVVEDSLTVRKHLCEVIGADPDLEVVGEAENGKQAIAMCQELRPDVVTMDIMLPVMSGLAATEYIMAHCPTPILVVSSSFNRGEMFKSYEALAAGAVDILEKPRADRWDEAWERQLVSTLKLVSKIRVITHPRARLDGYKEGGGVPDPTVLVSGGKTRVVAIGTSTGGPGAIVEVLRALPASYSVPILLLIHIREPFAVSFCSWLDGQSEHRVHYAVDGERFGEGGAGITLAPPNRHLVVEGNFLRLTSDPERHSCRPSVDTLFESVAREFGASACGCLLTGMGRDGAVGLLAIRQAGGTTIAQDENTCVVYGMPREAALLGAAERVLPLPQIGPALLALQGAPKP